MHEQNFNAIVWLMGEEQKTDVKFYTNPNSSLHLSGSANNDIWTCDRGPQVDAIWSSFYGF